MMTNPHTYLSLIIKGNRFQAAKAAAKRGVPMTFVLETLNGETVGRASIEHMDAIRAWYGETCGTQFTDGRLIGDLLLWSECYDRVKAILQQSQKGEKE